MLHNGTQLGRYTIVGVIGAGAMGEVYRARDEKLRRDVAIKVLPVAFAADPDRLQRFEREAHMLAALNHPHIAAIYGFEEASGLHALVLELVKGETLAQRLGRGALPIAELVGIARQIVDALDAAHERGIAHRDLKPDNIKITPEGLVKVLDFGLAKAASGDQGSDLSAAPTITQGLTGAGMIVGTPAYMSPEQARGKPLDKRTDIWSFGCVLYELLAARRAFRADTLSDTIVSILEREPDWSALPETTTPSIRRLLRRCLEKDPRRRLRDIGDARVELDEAQSDRDSPAAAGATHDRSGLWRTIAFLSAGALVATAAYIVILTGRRASDGASVWPTAQAIAIQLTNYGAMETAGAISPDGKSFVFVSDHGGTPDIWLRHVAGGDPVRLTNDAAVEDALAYSADGETIYFTRNDKDGPAIWRIGALGGQARKVLGKAQIPSPSPDGRRIAYYSAVASSYDFSLEVSALDGGGRRSLARVAGSIFARKPAWSPDGRWLTCSQGALFTPFNLLLVDAASGETRQLTRFTRSNEGVQASAWLPDNRHLVVSYLSVARQQAVYDLGILDTRGGSISRLTLSMTESLLNPGVSADGSRVIATAQQNRRELWKVPLGPDPEGNGRAATRLLDSTTDPMWTFVTRDGLTLLFNSSFSGNRNLWTMPLDRSSAPRQITTLPGSTVSHSSLSPDGSRVAFASNATGNSDIWVQNVDGSDLRQLTDDAAADAWPAWSPDGRRIMFASLRGSAWETRIVPAVGGPAEKIVDGFFRGDWIATDQGTLVVSSVDPSGLRVLDVERKSVLWHQPRAGTALSLPVFSPDGRQISMPIQESRDRDAVWLFETATGNSRLAARFSQPFRILFRANWVDGGKALVVNRNQTISHIVLFDRQQLQNR
jgi:serine/threonine protein kinase